MLAHGPVEDSSSKSCKSPAKAYRTPKGTPTSTRVVLFTFFSTLEFVGFTMHVINKGPEPWFCGRAQKTSYVGFRILWFRELKLWVFRAQGV